MQYHQPLNQNHRRSPLEVQNLPEVVAANAIRAESSPALEEEIAYLLGGYRC